jgi:hypothetical protein
MSGGGGISIPTEVLERTPRVACAHASAVQDPQLPLRVLEHGQCTQVGGASCPAWYRAA